jgi:putative membrane protein
MNSSVERAAEERRLHPVGMLLAALNTVRRWIGAAALPGVVALLNGEFGMRTLLFVLLGVVLLAILSAVWGVLSWRATAYRVSGGALHLKRGVLQKTERSLPLERVQSVDTVQGVVQRVFGVVEVRIEAAGGGREAEISLPALSTDAAETLREVLTSRTRRTTPGSPEEPAPEVLSSLSARDLLLAGMTSGQIGVAAAVVFGAFQAIDRLLPRDLTQRLIEDLLPRSISAVLFVVFAVALFAWVLAILGTVLTDTGFTLSRSADGKYLHIKRGLLERHESTVPLARIQAIKIVEGILRQPFGLTTIRVESAGFGAERGVSTTLFPLLPRGQVRKLLRVAVPEFDAPFDHLEPLPRRARRRYAFRSALLVLVLAALSAVIFFPWGFAPLLLVVPAALYGLLRYRAAGHGLDGERLLLRFRRLARTSVIVPRGRLQSRGYSVSPFQRRKELATFSVEVASGSGGAEFRLADIEAQDAEDLIETLSPQPTRASARRPSE